MNYELYTLPNCNICEKVKTHLEKANIIYSELGLGTSAGRKSFTANLGDARKDIERENQGIVLPVLIGRSDSKIEVIAQGEKILDCQFN